jgi:hypothetical protein
MGSLHVHTLLDVSSGAAVWGTPQAMPALKVCQLKACWTAHPASSCHQPAPPWCAGVGCEVCSSGTRVLSFLKRHRVGVGMVSGLWGVGAPCSCPSSPCSLLAPI